MLRATALITKLASVLIDCYDHLLNSDRSHIVRFRCTCPIFQQTYNYTILCPSDLILLGNSNNINSQSSIFRYFITWSLFLFTVFIVACAKTCGSNGNALRFMIYPCWVFRNFLSLGSGMTALKWATIALFQFVCPFTSLSQYGYAPHSDVSVNDEPHIRRWSHKIIIYIYIYIYIYCNIIL